MTDGLAGENGAQGGSPQQNVPPGIAGQTEIIAKCQDIVTKFRGSKLTKARAILALADAIPDHFIEDGPGESALQSYIEILDAHERDIADAARRGREQPLGGQGGGETDGEDGPARQSPGHDDDDAPSKKRKVDETSFPWIVDDLILEASLSPELAKTRNQLIEYAKDPKYVLSSLLNSTRHISFPESEWLAIIKGQAVNLDKVITQHYTISHDDRRIEKIGDGVELRFGSYEPTKSVKNFADWILAWGKASEAISYVFPHRRGEIDAYRTYVMDIFSSCNTSLHERVILLDRKIRNEVASRRDVLLSDFFKFTHWERSYLSDQGSAHISNRPEAKTGGEQIRSRRNPEPCIRFNEERCPSSAATCQFTHICSRCKRRHPANKCTRPENA